MKINQTRIVAALAMVTGWCLLPAAMAAPGSWSQKADMPLPASTPAGCVVDGILYMVGGLYPFNTPLRRVFAYDPRADSWTRKTDMPTARRFLAGATVDGIIYVIGGSSGPFDPSVPLKTVEAYDPKTDTWVAKADMPTARQLLAVCAVDGIIYAIGGGTDFDHPYATVEAYNPKTDQWSRKRDLPLPLRWLTASAAGGIIYVFVGTETHPYGYTFAYDPPADAWTVKAEVSPRTAGLMSATVNGMIYLFGGIRLDYLALDSVLAYDPVKDQFTTVRHMPRTRMTSACSAIDGKVILAGGVSKDPVVYPDAVYYTVVDVFDPQGGVTPQILSVTFEETNRVQLVWQAEAGVKYGVESSMEIGSNQWARVTLLTGQTVTATNRVVRASCFAVPGEQKRFYRVFEAN